jgi:hypothetical protein
MIGKINSSSKSQKLALSEIEEQLPFDRPVEKNISIFLEKNTIIAFFN